MKKTEEQYRLRRRTKFWKGVASTLAFMGDVLVEASRPRVVRTTVVEESTSFLGTTTRVRTKLHSPIDELVLTDEDVELLEVDVVSGPSERAIRKLELIKRLHGGDNHYNGFWEPCKVKKYLGSCPCHCQHCR